MEVVIDPLSLTAVLHHPGITQGGQVTGDLRLDLPQGMGQFTHAQFTLLLHQHEATQPGLIREELEKLVCRDIHGQKYIPNHIYGQAYILESLVHLRNDKNLPREDTRARKQLIRQHRF